MVRYPNHGYANLKGTVTPQRAPKRAQSPVDASKPRCPFFRGNRWPWSMIQPPHKNQGSPSKSIVLSKNHQQGPNTLLISAASHRPRKKPKPSRGDAEGAEGCEKLRRPELRRRGAQATQRQRRHAADAAAGVRQQGADGVCLKPRTRMEGVEGVEGVERVELVLFCFCLVRCPGSALVSNLWRVGVGQKTSKTLNSKAQEMQETHTACSPTRHPLGLQSCLYLFGFRVVLQFVVEH